MRKEISSRKARQGRWGVPVLIVLIAALVLAMIVWGGTEIYGIYLDEAQPIETRPSEDIR